MFGNVPRSWLVARAFSDENFARRAWRAEMIVVPIDTALPDTRKRSIIEKAEVQGVFFTNSDEAVAFQAPCSQFSPIPMTCSRRGDVTVVHKSNPARSSRRINMDDKIAYVMCTSGTTGEPKLVWVPHSCAQANLLSLADRYFGSLGPGSVVAQVAPLSFDPSIVEILLALNSGATLAIFDSKLIADAPTLIKALIRVGPSFLQCTPGFARRLGEDFAKFLALDSTCYVGFGGEPFPSLEELQKWLGIASAERSTISFFNFYGVTELSVWASVEHVTSDLILAAPPGTTFSLGEPLDRTEFLLVDPDTSSPVALLSGLSREDLECQERAEGVSYPELRAKRENMTCLQPLQLLLGSATRRCFVEGEQARRWRPTGDLVRLIEGRLYFVGRDDGVVKIGGKRFHPEEVSQILRRCPFVRSNHVWTDENGGLCAAVVLRRVEVEDDLGRWLVLNLPDYMRPGRIITLDSLPLNVNGKVDNRCLKRKLLEQLEDHQSIEDYCKAVWRQFGSTGETSAAVHLVSLGATSLDIVRISGEISRRVLLKHDSSIQSQIQNLLLHGTLSGVTVALLALNNRLQTDLDAQLSSSQYSGAFRVPDRQSPVDGQVASVSYAAGRRVFFSESPQNVGDDCEGERQPIKLRWKTFLGKCIDAAPLLVETSSGAEYCYVSSHSGIVSCLSVADGAPIWSLNLSDRCDPVLMYFGVPELPMSDTSSVLKAHVNIFVK